MLSFWMSGLPPGKAATTSTASNGAGASGLLISLVKASTCEVSQPMMPARRTPSLAMACCQAIEASSRAMARISCGFALVWLRK